MTRILQNPIFLLLATGTLLGFYFPLGKLAALAEISPIVWAMMISLGAVLVLLPVLILQGDLRLPKGKMIRYVIISAFVSYILPNVLLLSTIPHVGAGFAGLMFALSPVFTFAFSTLLKLKPLGKQALIGLGIGFIGAIIVSIARSNETGAPEIYWIIIAISVPLCLAIGNVYRSLDWPPGAHADRLAFWSHFIALCVFLLAINLTSGLTEITKVMNIPSVSLTQLLVAGMTFPIFFRLQSLGGPVLLSQIGYVSAAVSLIAATVFLNEAYSLTTWMGAGVISIGIFFTINGQLKS